MVIAAVDDLLFSSKIRTVAKQLGVELTFARTPDAILEAARRDRPAMMLFDLDSAKTDPVGTIQAIKADDSLAGVLVVGFVSHVHTERIQAAQRAGADAVLARSAFTAQLPDILASAR